MRYRLACWLFAAFALAAALTACGESPGGTSSNTLPTAKPEYTPTPVGLETPSSGSIYLGAYVSPSPNGGASSLEKQLQRKLALDVHYQTWAGLFPSTSEDTDISNGRIPVESWDCGPSNAAIAAGSDDMLIQTRAQAIKNFGHPVFLLYMWDPNLPSTTLGRSQCYDPATDNADGTFSASEYVAAWQHIRTIFAAENVTNVVWVWDVSGSGSDPRPYYPGSTQTDWIGIDAYDTNDAGFAATVSPTYTLLVPFAKPVLLAETGEDQNDQSSFLGSAASLLPTQFPMVDGFIYNDGANAFGDWTLSSAGTSSLATLGAEPYFSAYGSL